MKFTALATSPLLFASASVATAVSLPVPQAPSNNPQGIPQGADFHQEHNDCAYFTIGTFDTSFSEFSVSLVDEPVDGHLVNGFCLNRSSGLVQDSQRNNCIFDDKLESLSCSGAVAGTTKFRLGIRQPPTVNYIKRSEAPQMTPCTSLLRNVCLDIVKDQYAWCFHNPADSDCYKFKFCPWRLKMDPEYGLISRDKFNPVSPSITPKCQGNWRAPSNPSLPAWFQYLRWCRDHPESDRCPYLPWFLNPKTVHSDNAFNNAIDFIWCQVLGQCQNSNSSTLTPPKVVQLIQDGLEHFCTRHPPSCVLIPSVMEVVLSSMEVTADVWRLYEAILTGSSLGDFNRPTIPKLPQASHAALAPSEHSNDQGGHAVIKDALQSATLEFICEEICSPLCDYIPSVMTIISSILEGDADLQQLAVAFRQHLTSLTPTDVSALTEGAEDVFDIFATTPSKLGELVNALETDFERIGLHGTWKLLRAGLSVYFNLTPSDETKLFQALGDIIARFHPLSTSN
ncbi:hypothetical protein CORC01_13329 [Colletotrichum orchidophilum]|uniref:Uncharacterized protein n=1 Tax=Colletotrichum orchidophilum TaxID=1209926 RepID=A0A1G4AQQ5_9PEZI|nr:uncharacterized protein CORC01_13329 [Colletotrichum orchidophilum]OHE91352.1 hypothetical protein CORC01_13329 [Colletotrichum orchidophilum]